MTYTLEAWIVLLRAWAGPYQDDTIRLIVAGNLRALAHDLEETLNGQAGHHVG